ncbi:MAG: hypothetical protein IJI66_03985 [Erysipelotrichaceae bacterium]|nr:hypothetical protein [Erysipelotrichaceae bacterium]
MDEIFDPFGYWDLPIREDRTCKTAEIMTAIIAAASVDTAAIMAITDEVY